MKECNEYLKREMTVQLYECKEKREMVQMEMCEVLPAFSSTD